MRKYISIIFCLILTGISASAQTVEPAEENATAPADSVTVIPDSLTFVKYTPAFLDTVNVRKKFQINDYVLVGVEYGGSLNRMMFNPPYRQESFLTLGYYGVSITKYGKFFGYMPYFGVKTGLYYGHNGYKFKEDKETGMINTISGAEQAVYDFVEVPFLCAGHFDAPHFKLLFNLGPYAGYRLSITRTGYYVDEEIANSFLDHDHRWDYGIQGGAGFGIVFDPVEFHINGTVRYGFNNIYDADYNSKYYYRYAYPFDVNITAGIFIQLTKRSGKSASMLRKEAKDIVFGVKKKEE